MRNETVNGTSTSDAILVDPYRYNWTILEDGFCTTMHPNLAAIIVIHSATDHFERRCILRQMYGKAFYEQVKIFCNQPMLLWIFFYI
ncbi:unnamed protein product [Gongylonema pulchrum]|uniref:Hexosyltransferase n=1 Tax=Gongylonema pulchrum TaxID=637853 RepID=A0A183CZG6_9BILA|nr:unnamed protein product [Gongylonema pulchrum]